MKIDVREDLQSYRESPLTDFLNGSPLDNSRWKTVRKAVSKRSYPRNELANILYSYNQEIGNDSVALKQIERLKSNDSICVFTGQQLGFMGGPAYTIYKAITCLQMAREMGALPVFWLATEDHDIDEIDHTYLLDTFGNLNKFRLSRPTQGTFVEDMVLSVKDKELAHRFLLSVGCEELLTVIEGETSYCKAMAKVLTTLFSGTGLVFVEPYLLRPLAKDFFRREIIDSEVILQTLQQTTGEFVKAGGEAGFEFANGTNLFFKSDDGKRLKIEKKEGKFTVGRKSCTTDELLNLIDQSPERFSTNGAARPLLQSTLFPTVAYIAGPSELNYYHQLKDYHTLHDIAMPWVTQRMSGTIIPPQASSWLNCCQLNPWEPIPDRFEDILPSLAEEMKQVIKEWVESGVKHLKDIIPEETIVRSVQYSSRNLEKRVAHKRLKDLGLTPYALHTLKNLLRPHNKPQERVLNWSEFQCQVEGNLIRTILTETNWKIKGHHYFWIS